MLNFRTIAVLTVMVASISKPAFSQGSDYFQSVFTAFTNICVQSAPSFRGVERSARNFGVSRFWFRPQLEGNSRVGMRHGYSYEVAERAIGFSVPRRSGEIAITYSTNAHQIDRVCILTYYVPSGEAPEEHEAIFLASVESQFAPYNPTRDRGLVRGLVEVEIGRFDYEFTMSNYQGIAYLNLHIWE